MINDQLLTLFAMGTLVLSLIVRRMDKLNMIRQLGLGRITFSTFPTFKETILQSRVNVPMLLQTLRTFELLSAIWTLEDVRILMEPHMIIDAYCSLEFPITAGYFCTAICGLVVDSLRVSMEFVERRKFHGTFDAIQETHLR